MNVILSDGQFDVLWFVVNNAIDRAQEKQANDAALATTDGRQYWLNQLMAIKAAMERSEGGGK